MADPTLRDIDLYVKRLNVANGNANENESANAREQVRAMEAEFPGIARKAERIAAVLAAKPGPFGIDPLEADPFAEMVAKAAGRRPDAADETPWYVRLAQGLGVGLALGRTVNERFSETGPPPRVGELELKVSLEGPRGEVVVIRGRAATASFRGPSGVERLKELRRAVGFEVKRVVTGMPVR